MADSHGMPKPGPEHEKLSQFAGTWEGEETLAPSPWGPGGKATGRYTIKRDLDGFFLVQDYIEEQGGKVLFRGHGVLGFDMQAKEYTWYWVDSMGMPPREASRGKWEGDTLLFHSKSPNGEGRYTWKLEGKDKLFFKLENKFPGAPDFAEMMRGTYSRK